jgi:hypothetical protein
MAIHRARQFSLLRKPIDMINKLPSIFFLMILALTSHACSSPVATPQQTTIPQFSLSSTPEASTALESPSPSLTENKFTSSTPAFSTPTPTQVPLYFTEEWNGDTNQWFWFSTKGNDNLWDIYNEAGVLDFSLTGKEISAYFIYRPWEYDQVQITTRIENRAYAMSTAVIVCDYSEAFGWYEFNIGSDGLWQIRAHDTEGHTGYLVLMDGGSKSIHTGQSVNEYSATCSGSNLGLTINGTKVAEYTDKLLKFTKGKIGLGALSHSQIPVLIESAWIKITKP